MNYELDHVPERTTHRHTWKLNKLTSAAVAQAHPNKF